MKKFLRILLVLVVVLLLIAGAGVGYAVWHVKQTLPEYSGQVAMTGLVANVSVVRDERGVPHIFAENFPDAARALGYVHASERMFQMEMQRRAGQGRLSEVIGADMLGVDKFTRTLGLYRLAQSSFEALSPDSQKALLAYADGVNAWLTSHADKLPPEFLLLRFKPEPWQVADSVVWSKLMGLQLSKNYRQEMLRAKLVSKLSHEQMNLLFPYPPGAAPVTTLPQSQMPVIKREKTELNPLDKLGEFTNLRLGASNEWVIAGTRTESGKPILANDPHLGLEAPILWYLARIALPDVVIKGATVPGLPVVLLGQNSYVAWGFTTTGSDVQDLFIETLSPDNADQYKTPSGDLRFDVRNEVIKIKDGADVTLKVRSTRHGPVLSDIDPGMAKIAGEGKVMALSFTGLGALDTSAEALMKINQAKNSWELYNALTLYQSPPQNIVYADVDGNIGFINPGLVPVRKKGDGLMPVDGASGDYDWIGMVPFNQLPAVYNPESGFVFNANNAVTNLGGNYFFGVDWEEPYRAIRLQELFDTIPKHNLETSSQMQADHVSIVARDLMPYLQRIKPTTERAIRALAMLKNWDRVMDKDKPEPLIFEAWMYELHKFLLVEKTGEDLEEKGPFSALAMTGILGRGTAEWCGSQECDGTNLNGQCGDLTCEGVVSKAFDAALILLESRHGGSMESWRWGDEHKAELKHKVFSHVPFLDAKSNLSISSNGSYYTLDRGGGYGDAVHPFARTQGAGYRGIYDLGDPAKSLFMITTGQSGHILSPHYGDLVPFWNDVKAFPLIGSRDELTARGLPELVFQVGP